MTVTNTDRSVRETGNDVKVAFDFNFPVADEADLEIYKIDTSGSVDVLGSALTLGTDYTVELNTVTEGGTVTYTTAPTADEDSYIVRTVTLNQTTVIPAVSDMPEEAIESALDKSRMIDIQLNDAVLRAVRMSQSEDTTLPEITALSTGYLYYDSGTFSFQNITVTDSEYPGNFTSGADADKAASPAVKDLYYATDTNIFYRCAVAGTWTPNYLLKLASGGECTLQDSSGNTIFSIDESGNVKMAGNFQTEYSF